MKSIKLNSCWGNTYQLSLVEDRYMNGTLYLGAIESDTKEPFANITVNLSDGIARDNLQYVDANNFPDVLDMIEEYQLGQLVGYGYSGYCSYPLYLFDENEVSKYLAPRRND